MEAFFLSVVNMSITACYVILAVLLARLLLRRAPRSFSYALWALVLFRLICPVSFESVFSLVPSVQTVNLVPSAQTVSANVSSDSPPVISSGIPAVDHAVNPVLQHPVTAAAAAVAHPALSFVSVVSVVWLAGTILMLLCGVISFLRFRSKLAYATRRADGIWETDGFATPFVLGLFRPRIYMPAGLADEEKEYMLAHEKTHIRRWDHIIRPAAYLVLSLHWFNPLVWLSCFLMGRDMEMSCDESVLKRSATDIRGAYCRSLLSVSARRSGLFLPLAFGGNTGNRIKNILRYKRPALIVVVLALLLSVSLFAAFMTNPVSGQGPGGSGVASRTEEAASVSPSPTLASPTAQTEEAQATVSPTSALAFLQAQRYAEMTEEFGQVPAIETFEHSYEGLDLDGDDLPDKAECRGEEGQRSIVVEFGNGDSIVLRTGDPEYIQRNFQIKGVDLDGDSVREIVLVIDVGGNGGDGSCWMCVYKKENGEYRKISAPLYGLPYQLTWENGMVTVSCEEIGYSETVADAAMVEWHYALQESPDDWETLRNTTVTGDSAPECDGISDFIFVTDEANGKTYMKIKQYMTGPSGVHVDRFGYCITTLGWNTDGSYTAADAYFVTTDE